MTQFARTDGGRAHPTPRTSRRAKRAPADSPVFSPWAPPSRGVTGPLKRAEDLLIVSVLVVLLLPLLLLIACAIRLESTGPALFLQRRRGFNGKPIWVYKFRTMYACHSDPEARIQTQRDDPRVTRVGAFLRHHSLDELPQLLNVLKGDMSLVGPRPHAFGVAVNGRSLESIVDGYMARYQVLPGITGWAQVNGWRGSLDSDEKVIARVQHDLFYIQHWSLWLDCKILLRSFVCFAWDSNAF